MRIKLTAKLLILSEIIRLLSNKLTDKCFTMFLRSEIH